MLIRKWIPQSMDSAAPYSQTRIGLSQWGTIISGSNIVAFCILLNIIKASNCGVENGDRFLYYIAHGWWCICDDYMMMIFFMIISAISDFYIYIRYLYCEQTDPCSGYVVQARLWQYPLARATGSQSPIHRSANAVPFDCSARASWANVCVAL
jgi:hypothetical protein